MESLLAPLGIGCVLMIIGGLWIMVQVFRTSILWGLSGFVPILGAVSYLYFIFTHWQEAKKPFIIYCVGFLFIGFVQFKLGFFSEDFDPETVASSSVSDDHDRWSEYDEEGDSGSPALPTLTPTLSALRISLTPVPTRTPYPTPRKAEPTPLPMKVGQISGYTGRVVDLHLENGEVMTVRVLNVEDAQLWVERKIGKGTMNMSIAKSRVRGFYLSAKQY